MNVGVTSQMQTGTGMFQREGIPEGRVGEGAATEKTLFHQVWRLVLGMVRRLALEGRRGGAGLLGKRGPVVKCFLVEWKDVELARVGSGGQG